MHLLLECLNMHSYSWMLVCILECEKYVGRPEVSPLTQVTASIDLNTDGR